ncbi:unnamed protein product [Cochlearia groenlandica]
MKKLFKVLLFLFVYLTCTMGMVPYRGCDVVGVVSSNGKYEKRVSNNEIFVKGRKLVSGPSRSACGH